jgi:integrase
MAKKRGNNEGSIIQRPNGYWMAAVTIGYDQKTGKPKRKYFSGKTRQEVAKKLTETLSKVQSGNYIEPSTLSLEQWLNDWLVGRKPHITENTYDAYETMIRCHIVPKIGAIKLKDLRTRDIQNLMNEKLQNGRIKGKGGLSPRSVKYIYDTINTALQQATRERIIPYNVADAVEIPKQTKKEMKTMTQKEIAKFLDVVKNYKLNHDHFSPLYAAFYLELSTGLRRGELLGLRWTDIDFENKTVTVKLQLLRGSNGLYFSEPKTKKSKRTISLDNDAISILKEHKARQNELRFALGEVFQNNNLVFCTNDGKPIDPDNLTRHFETLLKAAGLAHYRFHDLRYPNINKIQTF